jgi:hypothetical protein
VAGDVMCGFMAHDEGKLVGVANVHQQRHVEGDDRVALFVQRLESIGGLSGPLVNGDLELARHIAGAFQANRLGHRHDAVNHIDKGAGRLFGRRGFGEVYRGRATAGRCHRQAAASQTCRRNHPAKPTSKHACIPKPEFYSSLARPLPGYIPLTVICRNACPLSRAVWLDKLHPCLPLSMISTRP